MDDQTELLREAVERQHGGRATFLQSVPVDERHDGKPVWQGIVHVFDLEGHLTATRAYAWSSPIEGSDKRRFYAVLHVPPVSSPVDAVRAAIVQEYREKVGRTPGQPLEPAPSNRRSKRTAPKRRLEGETKSNREIAMSIWELTPINLNNENWQRSPHKEVAIIRAPTENRAREIACSVFDTAVVGIAGQSSLHCPWRDDSLARCRRIEAHSYPDGPEAILKPARYNEEWDRMRG